MTLNSRVKMSALIIIMSAVYAVIIAIDPSLAAAVASWYVALLLTAFVVSNVRKKP